MSRRLYVVALVLASGCTTHTHSKYTLAHDVGTPLVVAPPPELVVEVNAPAIRVTATRACRAPASDVVVDTLHVTANNNLGPGVTQGRPGVPGHADQQEDGGEAAALFGLVAGIVTALDIVANDGKVTVTRERRPDEDVLCPASVRQIVVEVDLPSGLKLTGRTDDTGAVELFIPDSEPAAGMLTIRAPGMEPQMAGYTRPAPTP